MNIVFSGEKSNQKAFAAIHYCGHIISKDESGRFPYSHEPILQRAVESYFKESNVATAFGSLAAGADILIAESALKYGAELHLVFPYPIENFVRNSVLPSGESWLIRFNAVLEQTHSVTTLYEQQPCDEVLSYAQCTEVAIGLGLLSAVNTASTKIAKQLALWDENLTDGVAGSYPDMLRWNSLGLESFYFDTKFHLDNHLVAPSLLLSKFTNKEKQSLASKLPIMVAYQQQEQLASVETPLEFFEQTKKLKDRKSIAWDLDPNVFGLTTDKNKPFISNRCAGMLAFHLVGNNQCRDSAKSIEQLNFINTMRFQG